MRDPGETRRRLLAAALQEFSAKGIAGARVDAIAAAAGVNKRMLYYYFGSKEGLYRAVLAQRLAERAASPPPTRLADRLTTRPAAGPTARDFLRLHMWEALQHDARHPVEGEELRLQSAHDRVEAIRAEQAAGGIDPTLDPAQLALAELALLMFPAAFPQLTRLITGASPDSPEFRAAQSRFFVQLADRLAVPAEVAT